MDAAGLANFFENVGFRTYQSPSAWWYEAGPRFLMSLPSHTSVRIPEEELRGIFRDNKVAGVRYMSDEPELGKESYQIVSADQEFSLSSLSSNTRSKIRRGLKRNEIRRITGEELAEHGQKAVVETLGRQGRVNDDALNAWRRLLKASDNEPATEIWSAWHEGELAAYLLMLMVDDVCEFYQARSRNDLLSHYPNNALIYTMTEQMLVQRKVREVTFGIESAEDVSALDKFKFSMGYVRKPVRQRVVFHPLLRPALAARPVRNFVHERADRKDANVTWRKASGLIRFAGYDPEPTGTADADTEAKAP